MKLALDVSAVPPQVAGAGRYIVELARRLPERGVSTTLVTQRDDAERWAAWSPHAEVAPLVPRARIARLVNEAYLLGESAPARGSDLWHAPHYTMPRRRATPCVVTIHDLTFFTNPEWHERSKVAFFRRAINYSSRHARVLICVSAFSARLLEEILPAHAPIVVAPLGVELGTFQPDASGDDALFESHALPRDVPYLFFVGTVEPRKGLDVLLDAFTEVAKKFDHVELWLAGQAGWSTGPIETQIASHPYGARIRRLGFVDDALLPALYRQARVVAYPSRGEGFGLPVLEAMACGAMVVTTSETVMAEVSDGAAVLVPVGDSRRAGTRAQRRAAADRRRARRTSGPWARPRGTLHLGYLPRPASRGLRTGAELMRALVTGSNGFVGHHLIAHLLDNGDEVLGIDRDVDVTDEVAVRKVFASYRPDVTYHLAALTHVGESWDHANEFTRVNVVGTHRVLDAAFDAVPSSTTVVVSTSEVYGIVSEEDQPLRETFRVAPANPYSSSKVEAEHVAHDAMRLRGQRVVIARPFNHLGPGQSTYLRRARSGDVGFLMLASAGIDHITVGDLSTRRDFSDVRDVVRAYRLLAQFGLSGEAYNIASGHDVALSDIADQLVSQLAPGVALVVDEALLRPVEIPVFRGSYQKLNDATGWSPQIALHQTLEDVVSDLVALRQGK